MEDDVARDEGVASRMGIGEAGVGDLHRSLPWRGRGEFRVIGERAGERAGGGYVRRDARAGDAEPVEDGGGGKTRSADLDGSRFGIANIGNGSRYGESRRVGGACGRPAAVDVLKAVEVACGGAKALEIDVE